ncbi:sorting nexin-29 isoform X5 [Gallus gallus]|nr:sorting nexin-29 isoform X5 [Gallus gallus]XP_040503586.1 sorting nexin-29 isoform X5 [Gallus gallus]XP_040539777.1 sorting nexin-29 isoform X5 [Gallus gallus]XP_040539778.1 sorting nexin-29 isoform X5 [Gallus gallus]
MKRQFLLERLLDAVKQCQIRFGGRKEIASDSDSRVTCLCAQFEAVLQHGLRRSRGLALTAAAIKQAAGFSSKTETEPVFWYYVKEVLNKHELQRFYSLKTITTDIGRGRAWLRCALNEHSLERYVHMLLADKNRLSVFYEDWSFMMDEERSSMIPTMAAGLNSILFAINIDNRDLNGQSKCAPTVSDLLKESTQNVTSLLKESTQGVSSLLREITASSAVSILIKPDQDSDPLPVLSKNVNAELKYKKDRKKKKKVANIISFDEENDELNVADATRMPVAGQSSEENLDRSSVFILPSSETSHGKNLNGNESNHSWKSNSVSLNGEYEYQKLDVKSIDDEDADEDDLCGKTLGNKDTEVETESSEKPPEIVTCNSQICSWTPLQVLNYDSDVLFPVSAVDSYSQTDKLENGGGHENDAVELFPRRSDISYRVEVSPPAQVNTLNSMLPSATVPESMTVNELRQAIVAMMNRKDELEEQNRSLRNLLDGEMEHSAALRQEMDNWRRKVAEQEERHATKVQALARENEVLKVQLKKYVGAVQMLRREGQAVEVLPNVWSTDGELTVSEQKQVENNEELASSYERKLIEVAEMHGELIEFNERLHRALMAKETLVSHMRQELIDLRGPVPGDLSQTSEDQSLSDFEISNRALINVWIPSVFLRGKAANAFHVYQVYIRIKDDEWNVYRRYAEFRSLHHKLQNKYQQVRTFNFPPKKAIGNKDAKFVEERRKQLQNYLRNVMNKVIQTVPEFTANPKKETLIQLMPFFVDIPSSGEATSKSSCLRVTTRFPKLSRSHQREPRSLEPQSGNNSQINGLIQEVADDFPPHLDTSERWYLHDCEEIPGNVDAQIFSTSEHSKMLCLLQSYNFLPQVSLLCLFIKIRNDC